jgi:hypothetical protein
MPLGKTSSVLLAFLARPVTSELYQGRPMDGAVSPQPNAGRLSWTIKVNLQF